MNLCPLTLHSPYEFFVLRSFIERDLYKLYNSKLKSDLFFVRATSLWLLQNALMLGVDSVIARES